LVYHNSSFQGNNKQKGNLVLGIAGVDEKGCKIWYVEGTLKTGIRIHGQLCPSLMAFGDRWNTVYDKWDEGFPSSWEGESGEHDK
jgi:hypothetical protein